MTPVSKSLRMVVSGHGHIRSGLVVNQATTQRRWLVMASWYDSQGFIVRCGCVSASEEDMKYSDWIWYFRGVQWRHHKVALQDLQWTVTRMRWRSARGCVTPMTQEMSWTSGGLRLEVWLCAPESLFVVHLTIFLCSPSRPTYYVRAWNHQSIPEPDRSLYLAVTSFYSTSSLQGSRPSGRYCMR